MLCMFLVSDTLIFIISCNDEANYNKRSLKLKDYATGILTATHFNARTLTRFIDYDSEFIFHHMIHVSFDLRHQNSKLAVGFQ